MAGAAVEDIGPAVVGVGVAADHMVVEEGVAVHIAGSWAVVRTDEEVVAVHIAEAAGAGRIAEEDTGHIVRLAPEAVLEEDIDAGRCPEEVRLGCNYCTAPVPEERQGDRRRDGLESSLGSPVVEPAHIRRAAGYSFCFTQTSVVNRLLAVRISFGKIGG